MIQPYCIIYCHMRIHINKWIWNVSLKWKTKLCSKIPLTISCCNSMQTKKWLVISKNEYTNPFAIERNTIKQGKYLLNITRKYENNRLSFYHFESSVNYGKTMHHKMCFSINTSIYCFGKHLHIRFSYHKVISVIHRNMLELVIQPW